MRRPPAGLFLSYQRGYTSAKVCFAARTGAVRKIELDLKGKRKAFWWRFHGGLAEEEDYEVVFNLRTEGLGMQALLPWLYDNDWAS